MTSSTTEFNFIKIKPITDSRGNTGTFDSSITNVWCRGRELQIKNGLAKRLKKKKASNAKRTRKDDDLKLERRKMLRLVSSNLSQIQSFLFRKLVERKAGEAGRTQNDGTVPTEKYVHMNREIFSFADKSMRYGL